MKDERTVNVGLSLQELERDDWGEPSYPTRLITECHRLRRVPLKDLSAENWRMLLGQKIGMPYIAPMALAYLSTDPLASIDRYPGALLEVVLWLPSGFWQTHPDLHQRAVTVAERALTQLQSDDLDDWEKQFLRPVHEIVEGFLAGASHREFLQD